MAIGTTVSGLRLGRSALIRYTETALHEIGGRFVPLFEASRVQFSRPTSHPQCMPIVRL
jgi:hypothetical protein